MLVRGTLAGLLALAAGSVQAAETDLGELTDRINQCIEQQFSDDAVPAIFAQIDLPEACPRLAGMLAGHGELIATLSLDPNSSNLAELADLRHMVASLLHPAPDRIELERSGLPGILDDALQDITTQQKTGWWKQLIDWLMRRDPGEEENADLRWLENFLEKLTPSAATARAILYSSAFLIAALALALIWHEVRLGKAAGWSLLRKGSARNTREEDLSGLTDSFSVNPDALPASLPALLNICIDYLISTRRLPERKSRTNHEFLNHLQTRNDAAAPPFSALCRQAERVLYGGQHPDPSVIEQCLGDARSLLSAAPPADAEP
ncbi:MAG TPA: DUF4129 domain-containing protein [Gammaproteobacteria bacterium]|nr:DUF4129 domain-containing protein [Gammaproteobacteria bacterium]